MLAVLVYDVKVGFGQTPKAEWPWLISSVFVNRGGQWIGVSRTEVREVLMKRKEVDSVSTALDATSLVIVTYPEALVPLVMGKEEMKKNTLTVKRGEELPIDTLEECARVNAACG